MTTNESANTVPPVEQVTEPTIDAPAAEAPATEAPAEAAPAAPVAVDPLAPVTISFEDPKLEAMQRIVVMIGEGDRDDHVFVIIPTDDEGNPSDVEPWKMHRMVLARIFPHGRDDVPAACDFIYSSWVFAKHVNVGGPDHSLVRKTEEQVKLLQYCQRAGQDLLGRLKIDSYVQFKNLVGAVSDHTVLAFEAKQAREQEKALKKAMAKAKRDQAGSEAKRIKAEAKAAAKKEKDELKAKEKAEKAAAKKKEKDDKLAQAIAETKARQEEEKRTGKPVYADKKAADTEKAIAAINAKKAGKGKGKAKAEAPLTNKTATATSPTVHENDGWRDPVETDDDNDDEQQAIRDIIGDTAAARS